MCCSTGSFHDKASQFAGMLSFVGKLSTEGGGGFNPRTTLTEIRPGFSRGQSPAQRQEVSGRDFSRAEKTGWQMTDCSERLRAMQDAEVGTRRHRTVICHL